MIRIEVGGIYARPDSGAVREVSSLDGDTVTFLQWDRPERRGAGPDAVGACNLKSFLSWATRRVA